MSGYTEVTPQTGEATDRDLALYVYGKTAPPAGFDRYKITRSGALARVAAVDAAGAELRAWELPESLADRPALTTVEIQAGIP